MTLADARAGIRRIWREMSERTGVPIDVETVVGRLGPPLEWEAAQWFPPEEVDEAVRLYRSLYELAIPETVALPGAAEAIAAVRRLGGTVLLITAKHKPSAEATLAHLGLEVDEVIGW